MFGENIYVGTKTKTTFDRESTPNRNRERLALIDEWRKISSPKYVYRVKF